AVLVEGEAHAAAELLTVESVLGSVPLKIGLRRIEHLPGLQRLSESKRVARIHGIVTEEGIEAAMQIVGSRLADDVDTGSAGASQLSRVIAAVDLELLHSILAQCEARSAGIIVGFAAIHGHAVATAVASIEREPALRRLLDAKILVSRHPSGIRNSGRKQSESQVIASVDGQ